MAEGTEGSIAFTAFKEDRALYTTMSMSNVRGDLAEMESDFGILPYPKYDEAQTEYCSRVSYFMPAVMPATNRNLELVGAVLEYINYRAKENITPAYYDITLKGKVSRDEESVEMLDIILDNRVVDLGDTLFCASVRDGFFTAMYRSNNHDLASVLQKNEASMQKAIDDMVAGMKAEKE